MNDKKDYSLLRTFDLEAAKAGEPICHSQGWAEEFIAVRGDEVAIFRDSRFLLISIEGA